MDSPRSPTGTVCSPSRQWCSARIAVWKPTRWPVAALVEHVLDRGAEAGRVRGRDQVPEAAVVDVAERVRVLVAAVVPASLDDAQDPRPTRRVTASARAIRLSLRGT
jgi:hypothetical protein